MPPPVRLFTEQDHRGDGGGSYTPEKGTTERMEV